MTAPQLLLLADSDSTWSHEILSGTRDAMSTQCLTDNQTCELSEVRILVGSPDRLSGLIPHCPKLEWVQSTWAGVDAISHLANDKIIITGLKGVFGQVMSEFVLGWLLALERQIIPRATVSEWNDTSDGTVAGKKLGIMGTGSIGCAVAKAAAALNITCIGLNSDGRNLSSFAKCYPTANRLDFAKELDYLVSVLPKTPATDHLIDQQLLKCLRPGAIVINAGRANAVCNEDLMTALASRHLRYAVLDVVDEEPLPATSSLWDIEGLFVTSHTAAPTPDDAVATTFLCNFERFVRGDPLLNVVDPNKGY